MKIGMNMLLWTGHVEADLVPAMEAIKQTGFDGVEIPIFDPDAADHYKWLAGVLDDIGLERTAVALIPDQAHNPVSPDAGDRAGAVEHLTKVIDCCAQLGAQVLVGPYFQPLGEFTGDRPSDIELNHCADFHRIIAPLARDAGLTCAIENLNRFEAYLLNTSEQAIAHCRNVGEDGFGILYDTFHSHIEEKDPLAALRAVNDAGFLNHVHISENDRGTPGKGHAKIRETIAALKAMNYDGWMTIEAFGRGVPELAAATKVWRDFFPNPEEVYTEGYAYIRECWDAA